MRTSFLALATAAGLFLSASAAHAQATTETSGGWITLTDRCGANEGAPYFVFRWRGDPGDIMKFTMERRGSIHIEVPRGTTYVRNCGTYPPDTAIWGFLRLD